jgi:very-short-patch-repair endonuclease
VKRSSTKVPRPLSPGEEELALHLRAHGIAFEREVRFDPDRLWRFDFAIADTVAIEVEGGTWIQGRHNRGSSIAADFRKYNRAAVLGYRLLRFTTDQVRSGEAIDTVLALLGHGSSANH